MFRFKTAERLRALFTSGNQKQLFRPIPVLGSRAFIHGGGDRKVLPPELSKSLVKLTCESNAEGGLCDVYLFGTDHYSPKSSQEVKAVINFFKPEVVFLGLCSSHANDLKPDKWVCRDANQLAHSLSRASRLFESPSTWDEPPIDVDGLLELSWMPAWILAWRDLEVIPEFRVAYEEAQKYGGKVILGDRPRKITWHRSFSPSICISFSLFINPNMCWYLLNRVVNLDSDKYSTIHKELNYNDYLSFIKKVFVDERDKYMSTTLLKVAREHNLVVAVVGECHLSGISKYWKQPIEMEHLLSGKWSVAALVKKVVTSFLTYLAIEHMASYIM